MPDLICPLSKAVMKSHQQCPAKGCVFKLPGGCAMVLAAETAEDNQTGLHLIAEKIGVNS